MGVFEQALSNIAYLRAQAGGGMTRLTFAADALSAMETNMRAAIGRIEDVDIAEEGAESCQVQHIDTSLCGDGCTSQYDQRCSTDASSISPCDTLN